MFRTIDCRLRLARDVNHSERSYLRLIHLHRNRIAFERDYEIRVALLRGERTLPQTLRIRGLFPDSMIAFVDHAPERDASILQCAHVVAQIHEERGILGQSLQVSGEFTFQREAGPRVHPGFAKADRITRNRGIAGETDSCYALDRARKLTLPLAC